MRIGIESEDKNWNWGIRSLIWIQICDSNWGFCFGIEIWAKTFLYYSNQHSCFVVKGETRFG